MCGRTRCSFQMILVLCSLWYCKLNLWSVEPTLTEAEESCNSSRAYLVNIPEVIHFNYVLHTETSTIVWHTLYVNASHMRREQKHRSRKQDHNKQRKHLHALLELAMRHFCTVNINKEIDQGEAQP